MIYELRSYQLSPGAGPKYLTLLADEGLPLVSRNLPLLGFWLAETGALNTLWHLWAYDSWAEREACRAALGADKDWVDGFVPRAFIYLEAQENRLLQLDHAAPAFEAAVALRKNAHPVRRAGAPLFAPECAGLLIDAPARPAPEDAVASWQVLSGAGPARISLLPRRPDPIPAAHDGQHIILRPLGQSPL